MNYHMDCDSEQDAHQPVSLEKLLKMLNNKSLILVSCVHETTEFATFIPCTKVCYRFAEEVRVLKTCWKPHKSKDNNFLHRSYTPKIFSTPTKNIFSSSTKNIFRSFSDILGFSKGFLIKPL